MQMTGYFLGVDIGNTKSHAFITDRQGQVLGVGIGGNGNHEVIGAHGFEQVLSDIVHQALQNANVDKHAILGAGYGIAGYDWACDLPIMRRAIDALGIPAPYEVVNDCVIGLVAGARQKQGVVVVAGTGCNCRGRDKNGREGRVTGDGARLGESAGGGDLVMQAVASISRAWALRAPQTRLSEMFVQALGASDETDLLEGIVRGRYTLRATLAPLVFEAAQAGDVVAHELLVAMGRELGSLAIGVIHQLNFEQQAFDLVLAGSLYKGSPLIESTLRTMVHEVAPLANFVHLTAPPVVGGILLGMSVAGIDFSAVHDPVIQSVEAWFMAHPESLVGSKVI